MRRFIVFSLIIVCLVTSLFYFELPLNLLRPVFHQDIIDTCSREYDLNPLLVTALIKVESNFVRRARSRRGAVGLMQMLPSTAQDVARDLDYANFKETDLENPDVNIRFGTYYLSELNKEFGGNPVLTLAAYNAGRNKVQDWLRQNPLVEVEISDIPYRETRNYVQEVLRTYRWLTALREFRNRLRGIKE